MRYEHMDRRAFIKLTAVTGTSATLASCGVPEHQVIRFIPEDDLVPGVAEWKPSICPACQAGCGLQARIMEADVEVTRNGQLGVVKRGVAKKLEGNPAHPISQGALCPRGQAAIQITYHPDRVAGPLKRSGPRGSGQFQAVSWDDALAVLVSRLDALASAGDQKSLALLTRPRASRRLELAARFLSGFGAPPPIVFEVFGDDVLRRANERSFGREQLPTFDLERSRYVIAFGADFLGTWNSPVAQTAAYGRMRQGRPGVRGKFVQIESRMSQTGASADEWVPVKPGTEGVLALGLAHVIIAAKLRDARAAGRAGSQIDGWSSGLPDYAPAQVEKVTGVAASRVERLARELAELGPGVAMIGGAPLAHTNGLFHALAVNALNALLGSVGEPGGVFFMPQALITARGAPPPRALPRSPARSVESDDRLPPAQSRGSLPTLAAEILAAQRSPVQALLIDDANPVFGAPRAWRVGEALEKIPFIASFGSFLDETNILADVILPDHSFLESWVDASPESGAAVAVAGVAPPAMRPLHQTRATPDVLLDVGRSLARPLAPPLPWQTYEEMLHAAFDALPASQAGDVWSAAQRQGGWWGDASEGSTKALPSGTKNVAEPSGTAPARSRAGDVRSEPVRFIEPQFDGAPGEYPFHFLPYLSQAFLDGSLAHLPWLQELPDPLTSAMWSSWVEINPKTAERLGVTQGELVEIASRHGSIRAHALVSPGIAPDIVAMPVGQGHEKFTRYASNRGANPTSILAPMAEAETGAPAWAATRVRIARAREADGRLILFAGEMREHPHSGR